MANFKKPILYSVWSNMKTRCTNIKSTDYKNYGGRGINYCSEWEDYSNFEKDMLPGYTYGLTLDRENVNLGYYKGNCRWADKITQANNTRRNRKIEYLGVVCTLPQWARFFGIKSSTLRQRFYVYKWSIEDCLMKG